MNKKEKTAFVPKLRFPEYSNYSSWEKTTLNKLLFETKQRNRELKYGKDEVLSVSGEYGCVNQIKLLGRSYAGESVKEYHIVETGDVVYTKSPLKRNPFGIIKENKGPAGIVSTLYAVYRTTPEGCASYLDQYFSGEYNLNSYLQPIVRKGAKNDMKVNNAAVLSGEIIVPKLKEQQKIADCLSSIDDLIAAEDKKLEALRAHKKGLMQKLFPAKGKTVPEWRFSEFRNSGEWKNFKLSDIGEIITGSTPATKKNEYYGGEFMFASPADISDKRYLNSTKTTLSELGFQQTRHIKENSILFVCIGSIGKLAQNREVCATNQQINSLVPFENYHNSFVYFALEFSSNVISNLAGKQVVPIVNKTLFSNVVILLPLDKKEQEKISDCLSSVDDLIAAQSDKIEDLKLHKIGLMQGLFPSIEEVGE